MNTKQRGESTHCKSLLRCLYKVNKLGIKFRFRRLEKSRLHHTHSGTKPGLSWLRQHDQHELEASHPAAEGGMRRQQIPNHAYKLSRSHAAPKPKVRWAARRPDLRAQAPHPARRGQPPTSRLSQERRRPLSRLPPLLPASLSGRFVQEEAAARDRYSAAGRNPCPSVLLNPRPRRQGRHAGERSSQKWGARRGAGQPRERRLPGPRQAGPDPLQQHLRGQRYRPSPAGPETVRVRGAGCSALGSASWC